MFLLLVYVRLMIHDVESLFLIKNLINKNKKYKIKSDKTTYIEIVIFRIETIVFN